MCGRRYLTSYSSWEQRLNKCQVCGRRVLMDRRTYKKRVKKVIHRSGER